MEDATFESKTTAFITWLAEVGVKISPKMELMDLRQDGRGRGVGKFHSDLYTFPDPYTS